MFLDTSVVVKLLVRENDSPHYLGLAKGHDIKICDLAVTEVLSALMIKERTKEITMPIRAEAWEKFNNRLRLNYYTVLPVTVSAFRKAEQFILRCYPKVALRAMDALHLAVCDLHQAFPLITDDEKMRAAAGHFGIPVLH
ncbi:MAG: type II toxin-antitoxin system VapC family toxin [Verrucomicrobiales bacterium]|jgi:predicted nucleic acid-binding protein|nr:type II toxin-antitoxin system VapC family toxin [Verrucomicrobiales bacterium]